jgi:NAD+ synthase (glutamine-hydrolysing)
MANQSLCIAVSQLNYKLCDFNGNVAKIKAAALAAPDTDMIVFSELCLSGYHPLDLVENADFLPRQLVALTELLEFSKSIKSALVLGLVTRNEGPGKSLRNTLMIFQAGNVRLAYHKQLLPTYDVFDERRYFEPGTLPASIYEIGGPRIGLLICEDAWNDEGTMYPNNPIAPLAGQGIDLLININASPSHLGKREHRHEMFGRVAKRYGFALLYSNQVGGNDQLVFDGASFALNRKGELVHELPLYAEATTS